MHFYLKFMKNCKKYLEWKSATESFLSTILFNFFHFCQMWTSAVVLIVLLNIFCQLWTSAALLIVSYHAFNLTTELQITFKIHTCNSLFGLLYSLSSPLSRTIILFICCHKCFHNTINWKWSRTTQLSSPFNPIKFAINPISFINKIQ